MIWLHLSAHATRFLTPHLIYVAPTSPPGCGLAAQASLFLVRRSRVYVEVAVPGCSSLFLFLLFLFTLICSNSPLQRCRGRGPARTSLPTRAPAAGKCERRTNMWLSCWCCRSLHNTALDNIRIAMSLQTSVSICADSIYKHTQLLHFQNPRMAA